MNPVYYKTEPCPDPDCEVEPGRLHKRGCSQESCPKCGPYHAGAIDGNAKDWDREHKKEKHLVNLSDAERIPWSGIGDDVQACIDLGWYSHYDGDRWRRIPDGPEASPDLNRVVESIRGLVVDKIGWDLATKKFVIVSRSPS